MTETPAPGTALVTGACALVSGATGFLGGKLAAMLVQRGYRVRALARPSSDLSRLAGLGVEIVIGDVSDRASLERAAAGQRVVFHTAGKVTDWGPRRRVHAGQSRRHRQRRRRLPGRGRGAARPPQLADRARPAARRSVGRRADALCGDASGDPYTASKIAAEQLVRAAHGRGGSRRRWSGRA